MSLTILNFNHQNTIEASEIDKLSDEGISEIDSLEEEIDSLEEEKENLEEEQEEEGLNHSVRIEEIDKDIEQKRNKINECQKDVDHLNDVYKSISCYSEIAIKEEYLDSYIRENLDESYADELADLPDIIRNNIDWSEIIEESKNDYSTVDFDGFTYYFS